MVFLPGDHALDRTITVANVSRLTMHGESSSDNIATVVRNGSVGFSFTNMVDFNIYSLALPLTTGPGVMVVVQLVTLLCFYNLHKMLN